MQQVDLDTLCHFFASAPFMADLGVEPTAAQPGRVDSALALQARHYQHTGQVHAGVMVTMADHSMGAAAQTVAPDVFVITPPSCRRGCCARHAARGSCARHGSSSRAGS